MLVVVMNGDINYRWDIDEKFTLGMNQIHSIIEIYADGLELDYIRDNVSNIPMPIRKGRLGISWFGDHAKCVAGFLKIHIGYN